MTERGAEAAASRLHAALLDGIIDGSLPQGSRLRERELSAVHDVSRVPVREAIHRLTQEGFVVSEPRRGARVRTLTAVDVDELLDLRLCTEPFAAERAAERVAAGASAQPLREALRAADAQIEQGASAGARANVDIHTAILDLAGNALLAAWSAPLTDRMRWLFAISHRSTLEHNRDAHHEIVDAIARGDAVVARRTMAVHIEAGRVPIRAGLEGVLESA